MSTCERSERSRRWPVIALVTVIFGIHVGRGSGPVVADWLVTTHGDRVETRGPWSVRGRTVVFTAISGTLASMRLDEVDLGASEAATTAAAKAVAEPTDPVTAPPPLPPPPVLVLTDADIGPGSGNAIGVEALIEQLRTAHQNQSLDDAMRLVHWSGISSEVRAAIGETFAFMFARPLRSVDLVPVAPDETGAQEKDGVTYRPNLTVTGKLVFDLGLIEEDEDADRAEVTFLVGEVLGTSRIVAPTSR